MKLKSSVMTDDLSDQYISLNQKTQILHDSHTQADSKHIEYFLSRCSKLIAYMNLIKKVMLSNASTPSFGPYAQLSSVV